MSGERPPGGACGPQEGGWRGQGLGRATWPSGWVVDPPGQPQAPSGGPLPENLEYKFFCNFLGNFTVENFSKFKKLQKLS